MRCLDRGLHPAGRQWPRRRGTHEADQQQPDHGAPEGDGKAIDD